MICEYTSVSWDGEKYHYTCSCGHEVVTTDGRLPLVVLAS